MDTPPASTGINMDTPLTPQQNELAPEHISKANDIRRNLGKSTVSDFGIYRDILEEHVRNWTLLKPQLQYGIEWSRALMFELARKHSMIGESASLKCQGEKHDLGSPPFQSGTTQFCSLLNSSPST